MDTANFYHIFKPFEESGVLVGFSGGADSTALLILLGRIPHVKLKAVHFEHNIRPVEGPADAKWCRDFCEKRNIPFELVSIDVPASRLPGESVESAARRLRMDYWSANAAENTVVALGHNAGDRVENLFLRLARGSNASGLVSFRAEGKIGSCRIVRPLIDYSKDELKEFLLAEGVSDWREDSTNSDSSYNRNLFRNDVLPLIYSRIEHAEQGMLHSLDALELDADFIESAANEKYRDIRNKRDTDPAFWRTLHPALRIRALRYWLADFVGSDFVPDRNFFLRFSSEIEKAELPASGKILIPVRGNYFLKLHPEKCSLVELHDEMTFVPEWRWRAEPNVKFGEVSLTASIEKSGAPASDDEVFFDVAQIPDILVVRSWLDGDRMIPFGSDDSVRLKKIFSDRKVPAESKHSYPVVTLPSGEIIWLAGLRRSAFAPLLKTTQDILKIKINR